MSTRLKRLQEGAKMVHNWQPYARKIGLSVKELLGRETEVYIFGSAAREEAVALRVTPLLRQMTEVPTVEGPDRPDRKSRRYRI